MRQVVWLFLIIISLLFSCNNNQQEKDTEKPPIPKDQFIRLLTDLHKTDAYFSATKKNLTNDSILNPKNFFGEVFNKYGVTNEMFQTTVLYYCYRMPEFETIYDQVLQNLNQEKDSLQMINAKKKEEKNH